MTAPLFLADDVSGDVLTLGGDELHHATTVRRIQPGERVDVGDGRGRVAECVVTSVTPLTLDVTSRREVAPPSPRLVVVQALAKGDRAEDAVEAMTEVGVDEIVPWAAGRSIVRWEGERGDKALRRWRATAREAAKQSRRAWLPEVSALATTAEVARRLNDADLAVVLHESATTPLPDTLPGSGEVVVVIGPEGGIADEELAAFGTTPYRLGPNVLRTSTAGTVAAAILLSRRRYQA